MKYLSEALYSEFHRTMPIACVDIAIYYLDGILLIKRNQEPAKGQWWFPGGRILKSESLEEAASRILRKETNLAGHGFTFLSHGETLFKTDPFGHGAGTHTFNFVFLTRISDGEIGGVVLDSNHLSHQKFTFDEIYQGNFHPYLKRFVRLAENQIQE